MIIAPGLTYLDFRSRQVTVVSVTDEGAVVSRIDADSGQPGLWMVDSRILAAVIAVQHGQSYLGLGSSTVTHSESMLREIRL